MAISNKTDVYAWDGKVSYDRQTYLPRMANPWSQIDFIFNKGRSPYGEVKYNSKGGYQLTGNTTNPYKWGNYFFNK